jgi:hypothetical protein
MANDVLTDVLQGQDPALSPVDTQTPPSPLLPAGVPILPAPASNADLTNTSAPDLGSATLGAQLAAKQSPFLKALTEGADAASTAQQKAGTASAPGAWAKALVSGTQQALSGVTSALGDAAAVGELPKHTNALGGVLTGIARTEAARTQRLSAEENQKLETTRANINQRIQEANLSQLNDQIQEKHIAMDQQALAVLRTSEIPMETVGHDVNHDDITAMLNAKKGDPNKINTGEYTAFRSGTGEHGEPLFDVVKLPPKVSLNVNAYDLSSPEAAAKADKIAKTADLIQTWTGKDFHGSELTGSEFNKYYTMAKGAQVADDARKEQLAEQGLKAAEINDKLAWTHISPVWNQAIAGHEHDPVDALNTLETQHPDLVKQYPNLPELVRKNYGPVQWEDRIKANQAAATKALAKDGSIDKLTSGDSSVIDSPAKASAMIAQTEAVANDPNASPDDKAAALAANKTAREMLNVQKEFEVSASTEKDAAKQKATNVNPNNLSGQEYLNSLPGTRQAALQSLAEGRVALTPAMLRGKDGEALLDQLTAAYPGFDQTKGTTWASTRNEYMGKGATAQKKTVYNTALEHLQDIYDNSGPESFIPGSKAYSDRSAAMALVANEVGSAVKTGVLTEGEGEQIRDALGGWLPNTRKERIIETSKLLYQKIGQYQQTFNDAAPSPAVKPPGLLSPGAQASYVHIQSEGKQTLMRAPNGAYQPVDTKEVDHFKAKGATVVGSAQPQVSQ